MIRWFVVLLAAFSSLSFAEKNPPYVLMQEDLTALKRDFNEAVDQVRLLFIVGPT